MKKLIFAVALGSLLSLTGCPKGTQSLATASDTIAHALSDAQQGVNLACQASQIDAGTCVTLNGDFAKVAAAGKVLDASIKANESTTKVSADVSAFLEAFNQLNQKDLLGIKNPNTQVAISTILTSAEGAVATIAAYTGK